MTGSVAVNNAVTSGRLDEYALMVQCPRCGSGAGTMCVAVARGESKELRHVPVHYSRMKPIKSAYQLGLTHMEAMMELTSDQREKSMA